MFKMFKLLNKIRYQKCIKALNEMIESEEYMFDYFKSRKDEDGMKFYISRICVLEAARDYIKMKIGM